MSPFCRLVFARDIHVKLSRGIKHRGPRELARERGEIKTAREVVISERMAAVRFNLFLINHFLMVPHCVCV